jgi:hypothetical protein
MANTNPTCNKTLRRLRGIANTLERLYYQVEAYQRDFIIMNVQGLIDGNDSTQVIDDGNNGTALPVTGHQVTQSNEVLAGIKAALDTTQYAAFADLGPGTGLQILGVIQDGGSQI